MLQRAGLPPVPSDDDKIEGHLRAWKVTADLIARERATKAALDKAVRDNLKHRQALVPLLPEGSSVQECDGAQFLVTIEPALPPETPAPWVDYKAVLEAALPKLSAANRRLVESLISAHTHRPEAPPAGNPKVTITPMPTVAASVASIRIQAGSASWPYLDLALDDGIRPTHFSYKYEHDSEVTKQRVALELMPEIHVWVALRTGPAEYEVVDPTTCFLKQQAKKLSGVEWSRWEPSDFIWANFRALPELGIFYEPDLRAIEWARNTIHRTFGIEGDPK